MIITVLALAFLVGITLGMLGGGGSILTLPVLTYVAGMEPKAAIAASLFVVAVTSGTGVITHARAGRVRWRTALVFGAAGMVGAYGGGRIAAYLPARVLMVAFAVMMLATALAMLRGGRPRPLEAKREPQVAKILAEGVVVGVVTGIVGAGGGFLVVPALVLLGGLGMEAAIGTSLVVISMKSFAGFYGHLGHVHDLDWGTTLAVTAVAVAGSFVGGALAGRLPPQVLRKGFGAFVLLMAGLVLSRELL